jgi:hypothetical protein
MRLGATPDSFSTMWKRNPLHQVPLYLSLIAKVSQAAVKHGSVISLISFAEQALDFVKNLLHNGNPGVCISKIDTREARHAHLLLSLVDGRRVSLPIWVASTDTVFFSTVAAQHFLSADLPQSMGDASEWFALYFIPKQMITERTHLYRSRGPPDAEHIQVEERFRDNGK